MPNGIPPMDTNEQIKQLMQENTRLLKEIHTATEKTRRFIMWNQVWGFVKLLFIIVPLVIGYIYLKPYFATFGQTLSTYQDLLGGDTATPAATGGTKQITIPKSLWDQLQKSGILPPAQK